MHLTIVYLTNRREPLVRWFIDSLRRERAAHGDGLDVRVVMVDYFQAERTKPAGVDVHVPPKPSVWQGPYRLTSTDYFAPADARNTGLCLAPAGWIAYVDDLSVLMPGWLRAARDAMDGGYFALGSYKKVEQLKVEDGVVISCKENAHGMDTRMCTGRSDRAVRATGSHFYGCSVVGPVEAFLEVGGWDEDCDSMGSEDFTCGIMLERAGYTLMYDLRMLTLESEEHHHLDKPFKRIIKGGEPDASWRHLNDVLSGVRKSAACYWPGGIRDLRNRALAGEPFPVVRVPETDWRDGQPLSQM